MTTHQFPRQNNTFNSNGTEVIAAPFVLSALIVGCDLSFPLTTISKAAHLLPIVLIEVLTNWQLDNGVIALLYVAQTANDNMQMMEEKKRCYKNVKDANPVVKLQVHVAKHAIWLCIICERFHKSLPSCQRRNNSSIYLSFIHKNLVDNNHA